MDINKEQKRVDDFPYQLDIAFLEPRLNSYDWLTIGRFKSLEGCQARVKGNNVPFRILKLELIQIGEAR